MLRRRVTRSGQSGFRRTLSPVLATASCLLLTAYAGPAALSQDRRPQDDQLSYVAGGRDEAGQFAGGTEMRLLVAHGGKLYAGNGYWEDRPGPEGWQGGQILVLDAPDGRWRVDHSFAERMSNGRWRDLAVGALAEATFATDGSGKALPAPVFLLLASTWDLTGAARVFTRDDATGGWTAVTVAQDRTRPDFLPQIRSFGSHRDRLTGVDLVFAGEMPHGILAGHYDPDLSGHVRWAEKPELSAPDVATAFPGLEGRLRVTSFAEANGRLYAAVGQRIYERIDGSSPEWRLVYTNPRPGHSETGLRGLTAVPAGSGQALLAAVEGDAARLIRVDPATGAETTELTFATFLEHAWGMRVGYTIAAYNDMPAVPAPGGGDMLLIGVMAFIPRSVAVAPGHSTTDVGYGRVESGAWYLARWPDGHYELHQVNAPFKQAPVAVRAFRRSPFPAESGTVYIAGYDAAKAPAHDTAWIARVTLDWHSGGGSP